MRLNRYLYARMAEKFVSNMKVKTFAEGDLDTRGRKSLADVPVHYQAVRLKIQIKSNEPENKFKRLQELVARYCPVDSLVRAAVANYEVIWELTN